ncbi:MAG: UDP-N-acetylmuramate--L-alanine ligase [Sphingobacteriales bacterium]
MIKLTDIKHIYFIGIGGIGMSALARYFVSLGITVSGYDKVSTPLTQQLEKEGMAVHYVDDVHMAPKDVQAVVYTPAIPAMHSELQFYRDKGYTVLKRSDVLQLISDYAFNICVAGTHGKTTISTMIAHLLRDTGYGCNAFLGGIASNYDTNFWSHERNLCVIEADEYDRSFLKLSPDVAVISAMDPDHLDIYGTPEEMENAYLEFIGKIRKNGRLLVKKGLNRTDDLLSENMLTYSLSDHAADIYVNKIDIDKGSYVFDIIIKGATYSGFVLNIGGIHNVENMTVAIAVAIGLGIDVEKIRKAVANFSGVKRRFEYGVKNSDFVYIDDYAHHPEELRALINSVKMLYPTKKLQVVFQPHLFSRTQDLALEFASVLDMADEVVLLPIYPARELPIEGVTSRLISEKIRHAKVSILEKEEVLRSVEQNKEEMRGSVVFITAGAGDIDRMVLPIKNILTA